MRVAVIGLGSAGRRHVGNLLALGCEVYGDDPHPSSRARCLEQYPQVVILDNHALDYPIDAWVMASPWNTHLHWVELAIELRRPFFVEKPLGSLEQLPRWREIAQMDLPVNQVGYQCRFHPRIKAMLAHVGAPDRGGFYCDCDMRLWPGKSYGPTLLECSHDLDLALWCGAPSTVSSAYYSETTGFNIWLDPNERWLVSLSCESAGYSRYWGIGNRQRDASSRFLSPQELGDQMYRDELAHFLDCVREQKPTICPLSDGLRVLEVCQQVEQMVKQPA